MTGSFRKIDYRLRPAKHAERRMLVDIVAQMRFGPVQTYRYVGLGSVAFVDCRMFHRAFGITDIVSIEGTDDRKTQDRFDRNKPFDCVVLKFGMSWEVLPTIDFARPSIVWMDYDDQIRRDMTSDLVTIARTIAPGSFVAVTFATSFPAEAERRAAALAALKGDFPEFLADDEKGRQFELDGLAKFGQRVFGSLFDKALNDADAGRPAGDRRRAEQVCFFRYKDGGWMCTLGWVIVTAATNPSFEASRFDDLPFVRGGADPLTIAVPLVTPYEIRELEKMLPDRVDDPGLRWIPESDRRAFGEHYRYLPYFGSFEPL